MNRRCKSKESKVKMVCLIFLAVLVMGAAVYVVVSVFGKITSDYKHIKAPATVSASHINIETDHKPQPGWNETEGGWKYYIDQKNFVMDQWKEIGDFLYHFDMDGILTIGKWKNEGQIFNLDETKGYLKSIETDLDYVPEKTGENLDSLVRTNAFWCYLKDDGSTDLFKTIMYRRMVENKVMELGDASDPERTTKNSMRAYGDYMYYLPKVKESQRSRLTDAEKGLCDKLIRMIPGRATKELIADQVDGYLVLGNTIYYSQSGKMKATTSGTEVATGQNGYLVVIKDDNCYLVDGLGNPAVAEDGNNVSVGDRIYRIDEDGRISNVKHGPTNLEGKTYHLSGSGTNASVYVKQDGEDRALIRENYGVQSYCIVDNQIYYSKYVDKTGSGKWYSQIYKTDLGGKNKQSVSGLFPGTMADMYYYGGEGKILGEYYPAVWKQAYGMAVIISQDGSIYRLNDTSVRTGRQTDGNDMLEIVMAKDGKVICLWNDCRWNKAGGITDVLWSKAVELDFTDKTLIDTVDDEIPESSAARETNPVIQPMAPSSGLRPQTGAAPGSSINKDPLISTGNPGQNAPSFTAPPPTIPSITIPSPTVAAPTIPAPTAAPVQESPGRVEIVPVE